MIFFSSDKEFEFFYKELKDKHLEIDLLVTETPKKQGRKLELKPNPAHEFALGEGLKVLAPNDFGDKTRSFIKQSISSDGLGFIFAYGKIIPKNIIDLFENGILNIHFSILPEYPGASPIQQALLDGKNETGYSIFKITEKLDQGQILFQKKIAIEPDDDFISLRSKIIKDALGILPKLLAEYLKNEIVPVDMPEIRNQFTHRIKKGDALLKNTDNPQTAYNKIRAFSRWPKAFLIVDGKRLIIHEAKLAGDKIEITKIQPEGKGVMGFDEFKNGYQTLLTKLPPFVKID